MKNIKIAQLERIKHEVNIIDIRENSEFYKGRIPYSRNIPFDKLVIDFEKLLSKIETYYIVCQDSARSIDMINYLSYYDYDLVLVVGGTNLYDKLFGLV